MKTIISIVCCYNDIKQFNEFEDNLKKQTILYKLVALDNTKRKYSSCSKAYNSVISEIKTKYLIYSHQDIRFQSNDQLEKFLNYMKRIGRDDLIGIAGCKFHKQIITSLNQIRNIKGFFPQFHNGMCECETLDECFFGGHTEYFQKHNFDENLCNSWHLYAVDRCLETRVYSNKVYVCDVPIIHLSPGKPDIKYNINFYRLCKKYDKIVPYISTTCGNSYPFFPLRLITLLHRVFKYYSGVLYGKKFLS